MTQYLSLSAVLRQKLTELSLVVLRVRVLLEKLLRSQDIDFIDGIALNLHSFYGTFR